jgi:hypothetical protein
VTPWAALAELDAEVRVDELVDLGAALALVAEDGAKVRESLAARATSMRRRELAAVEGKAGEQSQSMLVAQILLCIGFLIFPRLSACGRGVGSRMKQMAEPTYSTGTAQPKQRGSLRCICRRPPRPVGCCCSFRPGSTKSGADQTEERPRSNG